MCELVTSCSCAVVAAGYSVVTHIPRGATNLDIRQYAPDDHKDDDIYLGNVALTFSLAAAATVSYILREP